MSGKKIIKSNSINPSPFLKWAGGKSQLLQQFESYIPADFNRYIEPFVGGGAVFFYLFSHDKIKEAILLDSNRELIDCYKAIKNSTGELVRHLSCHKRQHFELQEEYYYRVRNRVRNDLKAWHKRSIPEKAAITIYLNKTCFNGLYRVNRNNQFNVPVGRYKNPKIYNPGSLQAVSKALKAATKIKAADFSKVLTYARKSDFVYLDPPYNPLNTTSSFTGYTKGGFGEDEQVRLSKVYRKLDKKGCKVMLSNSATPFIEKLYKGYKIKRVKAIRAINCKAAKRGAIDEFVILNY